MYKDKWANIAFLITKIIRYHYCDNIKSMRCNLGILQKIALVFTTIICQFRFSCSHVVGKPQRWLLFRRNHFLLSVIPARIIWKHSNELQFSQYMLLILLFGYLFLLRKSVNSSSCELYNPKLLAWIVCSL